jgi:FkbM family methyltransferase
MKKVEVELLGSQTTLYLRDDCSSSHVEPTGEYLDSKVIEEIFESYKDKSLGTVLDCGANVGFYSHFFHQKLNIKNIIAIEPQELNCQYVKLNAPNATVYQAAVGDQITRGKLNVVNSWNSGATRVVEADDDESSVQIITIDALELNDLSFMKIDVEGFELKVLKGAVNTIARCKPVIYVEVHPDILQPSWQEFYSFVDEISYKVEKTFRGYEVFDTFTPPIHCTQKLVPL